MSQALHFCKQLRLLLIKDINALRPKLAAEPLEGVRARVDRDQRWCFVSGYAPLHESTTRDDEGRRVGIDSYRTLL
jgi:hypothetical protein